MAIHEFAKRSTTSGGEINDGANVGVGTGLVFENKTGVDLNFRSLLEGPLTEITTAGDEITVGHKDHYTAMVYTAGAVSVSSTNHKIVFDTAFGEIANFDDVNDRLIAPETGLYEIHYTVDFQQNGADMTNGALAVNLNGSPTAFTFPLPGMTALGNERGGLGGTAVIQMTAADYIEVTIISNITAGSYRLNLDGDPIVSFKQVA